MRWFAAIFAVEVRKIKKHEGRKNKQNTFFFLCFTQPETKNLTTNQIFTKLRANMFNQHKKKQKDTENAKPRKFSYCVKIMCLISMMCNLNTNNMRCAFFSE